LPSSSAVAIRAKSNKAEFEFVGASMADCLAGKTGATVVGSPTFLAGVDIRLLVLVFIVDRAPLRVLVRAPVVKSAMLEQRGAVVNVKISRIINNVENE